MQGLRSTMASRSKKSPGGSANPLGAPEEGGDASDDVAVLQLETGPAGRATVDLGPHGSLRSPVVSSSQSSSNLGSRRAAPRLRAVRSAKELVRSLDYDETSLSLARSQSQRAYQRFQGEAMFGTLKVGVYCSPVDRISRSRTPSAVALTMEHAEKVSKAIMYGAPLVITTKEKLKRAQRQPVTAPIAMDKNLESPSRLSRAQPTPLGLRDLGGLPESKSATALRMAARNARTSSKANVIETSGRSVAGPAMQDSFSSWDPMVLEAQTKDEPPPAPADGTADLGAYKANMDRYWVQVEVRMGSGAPSAAGAGQKRRLPVLSPEQIDGFLLRLAVDEPEPEYQDPRRDHEILQRELDEIKQDYKVSLARSVLDYELLDQGTCRTFGVDMGLLQGDVGWWCSQEYLIPEWRVLRITGVPNANVHRSFVQISRRSCSTESVMLDLQKLWLEPTALYDDEVRERRK